MRSLIYLLVMLLLCAVPSYAGVIMLYNAATAGGDSAICGGSCTPGEPSDVVCEDSEGSTTVETGADDYDTACGAVYTADVDAGNIVAEAAVPEGLSGDFADCDGEEGSNALRIFTDDDNGEDAQIYRAISETDIKTTLYLYAAANTGSFNTTFYTVSDGGDDLCRVAIYVNGSDQWFIYARARDAACTGFNGWLTGTNELAQSQWHKIEIDCDGPGGTMTVDVDGVQETSDADICTSMTVDRETYGATDRGTSMDAAEDIDYYIDMMQTDDDTQPPGCI